MLKTSIKCECGHTEANHRSDYGCMGQHKVLLTECSCKSYSMISEAQCFHTRLLDISSVKASQAILKCSSCKMIVKTELKVKE